MRRGELLGLRWEDLDLAACRLSVNRTLISVAYELHESRDKTRTARRSIDLDPRTVDLLASSRRVGSTDESYVFAHDDGSHVHPQVLSDAFKKLVARSGLPRIRLHDLRRTNATLLLKAGVPIKVVSERLGHATPAFTMATYQHRAPWHAGRGGATVDKQAEAEHIMCPAVASDLVSLLELGRWRPTNLDLDFPLAVI
jgi:integrase